MSDEKKLSDRLRSYLYSMHPIMLSVGELFRYADEIADLEQRLAGAEAEGEKQNPWKAALIDELIVDCIYTKEHDSNPKKALGDAIEWNCKVALDPAVSKEARDLQQAAIDAALEGVVEYLRERGRTCNRESTASIKRANGNITIYSDNLSKEANKLFHYANDVESKFKGTNPLAEAQARIAELEQELKVVRSMNPGADAIYRAITHDNVIKTASISIEQHSKQIADLTAQLAEAKKDAERYRWLCADLVGEERIKRNGILCRMPVMSYSAASADIDAAMRQAANLRKILDR